MPSVALPQTCVELLRSMVRHDSVTPRTSGRADAEAALGDHLAETAEGWGLTVRRLPVPDAAPNVLITHEVDSSAPWLLFDSHLDTVGVEGMTIDPFAADVRHARLHGRGACDTKGSGAAMLWAMKEAAAHRKAASNLALLFSVGEEVHQIGARRFIECDLPELRWRPSGIVVGEPTSMRVVRAANGFVRFQLVAYGHAAHSSEPEKGHNAVSDMARAVVAIEDNYIAALKATHAMTGRSTCSVNIIHGGTEHNVVPERCSATVDHRLVPGQSFEDALAGVRAVLAKRESADPSFDVQIEEVETAPPFAPDLNGRLSEWAASELLSADIPTAVAGAPYTTNANHYAAAGLPSIVLGPGDIAQAHTRDEWIALEQLELGVRGYQRLVESPLR